MLPRRVLLLRGRTLGHERSSYDQAALAATPSSATSTAHAAYMHKFVLPKRDERRVVHALGREERAQLFSV